MSKKFYLLICVVFVLALARGAAAQEYRSWWSDLDASNDWDEPNNWWTVEWPSGVKAAANSVPDINSHAYIGKGGGWQDYPAELNDLIVGGHIMVDPTIDGTIVAEVNYILVGGGDDLVGNGFGDPCADHYLTVTGGTLTLGANQDWGEGDIYERRTDWYEWGMFNGQWASGRLAIGACLSSDVNGTGTMTMSGGVVNVGGHVEVGSWGSVGLLDMTGGEMNIFQGVYCTSSWAGETGQINLHGGTINARYLEITDNPYGWNTGIIDVTGGELILERNQEDTLAYYEDYANVGLYGNTISITSYGAGHGEIITDSNYAEVGKRAALVIDYDVSNEAKTTLAATTTDPCQAWGPSPADGAGNVKGPPASLQRPVLSWSDGNDANTHDVYFGTSLAEVNNADTASTSTYIGNQNLGDVNWPVDRNLEVVTPYYWRIDEVNVATVKGEVWDFTVANVGKSSYPSPSHEGQDVPSNVTINWTPGIFTVTHDVYLGTSFDDVNEATSTVDPNNVFMGNQGPNTFDVCDYDPNALVFSTTYYWRIDDVNGGTTYPGDVWSFTTASHLIVEDFDSYVNQTALWNVWDDWTTNSTGAAVFVEKEPTYVRDGNSLKYDYDSTDKNGATCVGSIVSTDTTRLGIGSDWTVSDARALVVYFLGQAGNNPNSTSQLYLQLEDTSSASGVVLYDDMNDVAEESWHEWNIDLAIFDACGVSLANIDKIHIGFGGETAGGDCDTKAGGTGTVWFDDIQIWPARCVPVEASIADFTDDCIVDGYDLELMSNDWMMADFNTLGYMGTLRGFTEDPCDPNHDLCWVTGRIGTGALEFGVGHTLTDPCCTSGCYSIHEPELDDDVLIPPLQLNTNTVTFTCWAKSHGPQWPDTALFHSDGSNGEFEGDTVVGWDVATYGAAGLGYNWNNSTWNWDPPGLPELPVNEWAFNALVIGPTQATMYMKIDGDATLYEATNIDTHDPEPFEIPGHIGSHKWRYFDGLIDDFRIYDYSLTQSEIQWLAYETAQGTDPTDANLYAHYKFDDGSGLTALDDAGDMLNYWHVPSQANITGDNVDPNWPTEAKYRRFVNMRDFSLLANDWLVDMLFPYP